MHGGRTVLLNVSLFCSSLCSLGNGRRRLVHKQAGTSGQPPTNLLLEAAAPVGLRDGKTLGTLQQAPADLGLPYLCPSHGWREGESCRTSIPHSE